MFWVEGGRGMRMGGVDGICLWRGEAARSFACLLAYVPVGGVAEALVLHADDDEEEGAVEPLVQGGGGPVPAVGRAEAATWLMWVGMGVDRKGV